MPEGRTFTIFGKLGHAYRSISSEEAFLLSHAVMMYGLFGEDTDLSKYPNIEVPFQIIKDDIDYSINRRMAGRQGGRPSKT